MALPLPSTFNDSRPKAGQLRLILLIALAGVLLRFVLLANPGHLFGITEYDDGVYFGAALRLTQGLVPYRDYVMVQPPGIAVILSPIAFLARIVGTANGLAIARVVTVFVGGMNIVLCGLLMRSRGSLAIASSCGLMAVYPEAIMSSQTVLLEPYLNLFSLLALLACFSSFRFRSSRAAIFLGGALLGLAGSIKVWAIIPFVVLGVVMVVASRHHESRRPAVFVLGTATGFAVACVPFILLAPREFFRQVVSVQASRVPGSSVPLETRLADLSGSTPLTWLVGHAHLVVFALSAAFAAVFLLAVAKVLREATEFGVFVLISAVLVFLALMWPRDFYYHYADFEAPFLALTLGMAFSSARRDYWGAIEPVGTGGAKVVAIVALSGAILIEGAYLARVGRALDPAATARSVIPSGACVVSDQASLLIVSNRFFSHVASCPSFVDSYGTALALSGGKTIDGGAAAVPSVVSFWMGAMRSAQFLWLTPQSTRRVPWTDVTRSYFDSNFVQVVSFNSSLGTIYRRAGG